MESETSTLVRHEYTADRAVARQVVHAQFRVLLAQRACVPIKILLAVVVVASVLSGDGVGALIVLLALGFALGHWRLRRRIAGVR